MLACGLGASLLRHLINGMLPRGNPLSAYSLGASLLRHLIIGMRPRGNPLSACSLGASLLWNLLGLCFGVDECFFGEFMANLFLLLLILAYVTFERWAEREAGACLWGRLRRCLSVSRCALARAALKVSGSSTSWPGD